MAIEDKFNVNLNQNLWALVVAYVALGAAEYWDLKWLFRLSLVVSIGLSISETQMVVDSRVVCCTMCVQRCFSLESERGQERTLYFSGSTGANHQPYPIGAVGIEPDHPSNSQ